jgi:hypothetical protein
MNVEIGAEAAQFPEKEYINGIAFAVYQKVTYIAAFLPCKPMGNLINVNIQYINTQLLLITKCYILQ